MKSEAQVLIHTYMCFSAFITADVSLKGLIVLYLFLLRWDVFCYIQEFNTLTRQFFIKKQKKSQSLLRYLSCVFKCWLLNGCYDVFTLKVTLKSCFDLLRQMFDTSAIISEIKVGVTVSAILNTSSFVFFNYNELNTKMKECDKNIKIIEASTGFFINAA